MLRTKATRSSRPRASSRCSSSKLTSKWSSIALLPRPVTMMMFCTPERMASSTPYWMSGLSTSGSISLGGLWWQGGSGFPSPPPGRPPYAR